MVETTLLPEDALTFPRFPDLPAELRLVVWSYLLPHRVVELDMSTRAIGPPLPGGLTLTSTLNGLPPLISRVCRESRAVALQSRSVMPEIDVPEEASWKSGMKLRHPIDPLRDIIHLNWEPGSAEFPSHGGSFLLPCLARSQCGPRGLFHAPKPSIH